MDFGVEIMEVEIIEVLLYIYYRGTIYVILDNFIIIEGKLC
jgi:hypothetical protein